MLLLFSIFKFLTIIILLLFLTPAHTYTHTHTDTHTQCKCIKDSVKYVLNINSITCLKLKLKDVSTGPVPTHIHVTASRISLFNRVRLPTQWISIQRYNTFNYSHSALCRKLRSCKLCGNIRLIPQKKSCS